MSMLGILAAVALASVAVCALVLGASYAMDVVRANRLLVTEQALLRERIAQLADRVARLDPEAGELAWSGFRKFMLLGKVLEGEDVCSFYLAPHDGQALPAFLPGQYLTFRLASSGSSRPLTRCYSLSDSPTHPDYYRITVKRLRAGTRAPDAGPGAVSTELHHRIAPDELIDVKAPAGHFHLDLERRSPVVLAAGGIGITPILSMLNYIAAAGSNRETWVFYGVTHGGQHIMREHLRSLADEHENIHLHVCYSAPRPGDREGPDYDHAERVSVDLFRRVLPSSNYDFYTCGPPAMMDQITHELEAWGVPSDRIHWEAFGPATVRSVGKEAPETAAEPVPVEFARSGRTLTWDPSSGSLLDFAEASGIPLESGCRAGSCGSCAIAVRAGAVQYLSNPGAPVEDGSCLTCIAVPNGPIVLDA